MERFLQNACSIFETARTGPGGSDCMAMLVGFDGSIRVVDATGWSPVGLQAHYGVREVYRVDRSCDRVQVQAASGRQSCTFSSPAPSLTTPVFHSPLHYFTEPATLPVLAARA